MNDQTIYWIWIQQAIGYASRRLEAITGRYTFAEEFYRAPLDEKMMAGGFSFNDRMNLSDLSLDAAGNIIRRCRECGVDIISYNDMAYPQLLREIASPPAVLYVKGQADVLSSELSIGIVGTRSATFHGRENAYRLSYDLAKKNVCIVSGGALGIDTVAHRGALRAGGKTVCVLGCGHDAGYLRENEYLRQSIAEKGAVISEYPPDFKPSRVTFPQRNRIISGLSAGILVVEAGKHSGSLITAGLALEQGRDVFAVPGDIGSYYAFGTNSLIKDGAAPVTRAEDILAEYRGVRDIPKEKTALEESLFLMDFSDYLSSLDAEREKKDKDLHTAAAPQPPKQKREAAAPAVKKEQPRQRKDKEEKKKETQPESARRLPEDLSNEAVRFYEALSGGEQHIDAVAEKTGLSVSAVHAAATELEMNDLIESLPGRRYKRIDN